MTTDDFSKPKIVYPETTQGAYFAIDTESHMADKTCFIMITEYPLYLQSILSSRLYEFAYKRIFSSIELGESAYQYNKHALIKLPVIPSLIDQKYTDNEIYGMYDISDDEISFIETL